MLALYRGLIDGISKTAEEQSLAKDLMEFFEQHHNPSDESFHRWAEERGHDVERAEEMAYRLASIASSILNHGKAKQEGTTEKDVDQEQLRMGIEVEKEHTNDEDVARRVALDHLSEPGQSRYYSKLKEMEGKP